MTSLIAQDKAEAKRRGLWAALSWGGSVALMTGGMHVLGGMAIAGAGVLTYRWFMFRARRGMRF